MRKNGDSVSSKVYLIHALDSMLMLCLLYHSFITPDNVLLTHHMREPKSSIISTNYFQYGFSKALSISTIQHKYNGMRMNAVEIDAHSAHSAPNAITQAKLLICSNRFTIFIHFLLFDDFCHADFASDGSRCVSSTVV